MKKRNQEGIQLSLFDDEDFVSSAPSGTSEESVEKMGRSSGESVAGRRAEEKFLALTGTTDDARMRHEDHTELFNRLAQSDFRRSFHLKKVDKDYIRKKGLETIRMHAADFVSKRLAPAVIGNDGKQTPMRGHPVFIAQHATACCCRGCFSKWHHIPAGRTLTEAEQAYAVDVLMSWIEKEYLS